MELIRLMPSQQVADVVHHYLFLRTGDGDGKICDRFIPSGYTSIVMNYKGIIFSRRDEEKELLPAFFTVPPASRALFIEGSPPIDSMVAVCRTPAFSRIFGIAMDKVGQGSYFCPGVLYQLDMYGWACETADPFERVRRFEAELSKVIRLSSSADDEIDRAFDEIITSGGTVPVSGVLGRSGLNPRTFRRRFRSRVGLCAKSLSRIARVNALWDHLAGNQPYDLFDAICRFGFHDQSHLIKDFRDIVGETPYQFFTRNHEQARLISGKNRN